MILVLATLSRAIYKLHKAPPGFRRIYIGVIIPATFIAIGSILDLTHFYVENYTIGIVASHFEYATPLFTWWIVFDIITLASYRRRMVESNGATKVPPIPNTEAKWYIYGVFIVAITNATLAVLVAIALVFAIHVKSHIKMYVH